MADIMKMGKNPNYLGSWDLDELPGKEVTLTIARIVDEDVVTNGSKERCTVCYWTDNNYKPMVLNVTNKKTIAKLYHTKETEKLMENVTAVTEYLAQVEKDPRRVRQVVSAPVRGRRPYGLWSHGKDQ